MLCYWVSSRLAATSGRSTTRAIPRVATQREGQQLCFEGRCVECIDGEALGDRTCTKLGFDGGTLVCKANKIDRSRCFKCGDGKRSGDEPCEGSNTEGKTCRSEGFAGGGLLRCHAATCTLDTSQCRDCVANTFSCRDSSTLNVCGQSFKWLPTSCSKLCVNDGWASAIRCKGSKCECRGVCTWNETDCLGSSNLRKCEAPDNNTAPKWVTKSCETICHESNLGKPTGRCAYDSTQKRDLCYCWGGSIGDPCTSHADCLKDGGTCTGKWCSKKCTSHSNCGSGGGGRANHCITTSTGTDKWCFPSCLSKSCSDYPGTTCQTLSNGLKVCSGA